MGIKKVLFNNIKGMTQDLAPSKFNPEMAYELKNFRLVTAGTSNDTGALTNEKGTYRESPTGDVVLSGTPIGQAQSNDALYVFYTEYNGGGIKKAYMPSRYDSMPPENRRVEFSDPICNLTLNVNNPVESIFVYENENIQKIYWVDGIHQPRVINVKDSNSINLPESAFDFVREIATSRPTISITRNIMSGGSFAPGTVQYFYTTSSLHGQETNVIDQSPLLYVSYSDRGASPEDVVGVSFSFNITGYSGAYNAGFKYLNIYCINRTSLNAPPQTRKVISIEIPNSSNAISFTDYGTSGEAIDPTDLFYKGGIPIVANTIAQKDNTLFLGGIKKLSSTEVSSEIKESIHNNLEIEEGTRTIPNVASIASGVYSYFSTLVEGENSCKTFKKNETYRFGVQLQDKYGIWSNPIYITDFTLNDDSSFSEYSPSLGTYKLLRCTAQISALLKGSLSNAGYTHIRPLVVFPTEGERSIVCQGVLCPTVYNVEDRYNNFPTAVSSWFFRPNAPYSIKADIDVKGESNWSYNNVRTPVMSNYAYTTYGEGTLVSYEQAKYGKWAEFRHNKPIPSNDRENAEIQCISSPPDFPLLGIDTYLESKADYCNTREVVFTESTDPATWVNQNKECFYIDQSIVTLNSPDIEFSSSVKNRINSSNLNLRIVGMIPIESCISDIDIQASTPTLKYSAGQGTYYQESAPGFFKAQTSFSFSASGHYGWKSALSGGYWRDELYGTTAYSDKLPVSFVVYPWHRHGSLNNTKNTNNNEEKSAMLSQKKMSIARWSGYTNWLYGSGYTFGGGISGARVFDSTEDSVIRIPAPANSGMEEIYYKGNVDSIITFHTSQKHVMLDGDTDLIYTTSTMPRYPIVVEMKDRHSDSYPIPYYQVTPGQITAGEEMQNYREADTTFNLADAYSRLRFYFPDGNTNYKAYTTTDAVQTCSSDPVYMKYKSSPHAVIALNYGANGKQAILPSYSSINAVGSSTSGKNANSPASYSNNRLFWDRHQVINGVYQYDVDSEEVKYPSKASDTGFLWLGELYTTDTPTFGGNNEQAFKNNTWVPAGPSVSLSGSGASTIAWDWGDTYYQRYDCLKTYPYTQEDENSVVDILSFMVETRVNIDGRYDTNRGRSSNLYVTKDNFNLINPAYSQEDNFMSYHGGDSDNDTLTKYDNTITWTKTKTFGENVDSWTQTTLASTLDLDGSLGKIRALRTFKNEIFAFQDSGISQILYNESVQVVSTTGVPIEIANSGKVSGKRYISNKIGCINKWSICTTANGMYFHDSLSNDLYFFNGSFHNLTDKFGFHSWANKYLKDPEPWAPNKANRCIAFYDREMKDVLFTTNETCLAFSEQLNQFSGFYDYVNIPIFGYVNNRAIALHQDDSDTQDDNYYIYEIRKGNYNNFFGVDKPFNITVLVNPNTNDKIFNNVEYIADGFNSNTGLYDEWYSFDHIRAATEYQLGESTLTTIGRLPNATDTRDVPTTLKKKFRVWRANIPRWNRAYVWAGVNTPSPNNRDRMRNPWLKLTLAMEGTNLASHNKFILHNLAVNYFE